MTRTLAQTMKFTVDVSEEKMIRVHNLNVDSGNENLHFGIHDPWILDSDYN